MYRSSPFSEGHISHNVAEGWKKPQQVLQAQFQISDIQIPLNNPLSMIYNTIFCNVMEGQK